MKNLGDAIALAAVKHAGQVRRDGTPYIYHPLKVAEVVKNLGYDEKYQIVAVLHDVLEDTDATENDIKAFGEDIFEAVDLLTRKPGADEAKYVSDILNNHMAAVVKNVDKIHNMWSCVHIGPVGSKYTAEDIRFAKRYIKKAETYYYNKFSSGCDSAIRNASAALHYTTVRPTSSMSWDEPNEMTLYSDIAARFAVHKAHMKKIYDNEPKPDVKNENTHFYDLEVRGGEIFFCVPESIDDPVWELSKAGWILSTRNIGEYRFTDKLGGLSREAIASIINYKKKEGFFYDFVDVEKLL